MTFTTKDALTVATLLREAALAEIMPRFRTLTAGQIRQKSSATDAKVRGPVSKHVVDATANNSEWHSPHRDFANLAWDTTTRYPTLVT